MLTLKNCPQGTTLFGNIDHKNELESIKDLKENVHWPQALFGEAALG